MPEREGRISNQHWTFGVSSRCMPTDAPYKDICPSLSEALLPNQDLGRRQRGVPHGCMPKYIVRTTDHSDSAEATFSAEATPDEVLAQGVQGALEHATAEIKEGQPSIVIEVIVEDDSGQSIRRSAVTASVSQLAID